MLSKNKIRLLKYISQERRLEYKIKEVLEQLKEKKEIIFLKGS